MWGSMGKEIDELHLPLALIMPGIVVVVKRWLNSCDLNWSFPGSCVHSSSDCLNILGPGLV